MKNRIILIALICSSSLLKAQSLAEAKIFTSNEQFESASSMFKVIIEKDIFNKSINWWTAKLTNIKIVIHLAWEIDDKYYYNSSNNFKCFNGTLNLATACCNQNIN